MKLLLTLMLITNLSFGQQGRYYTNFKVTRIPVTQDTPRTEYYEKITFINFWDSIRYESREDTLELRRFKRSVYNNVYEDKLHNNQLYSYEFIMNRHGFRIIFVPLPPYKKEKLWSITLTNI